MNQELHAMFVADQMDREDHPAYDFPPLQSMEKQEEPLP